ncbi:MAG: hypothetical protein K6U08_00090 [Firmicutes bacterium]|nr:hypothetical protein [Bacillota bacterium]
MAPPGLDVGVAPLDPAFVYSHVGRREAEYGRPVRLDHPYAVVFTVEMDHRLVRSAPGLGTTVESSSRYLEAAKIALALSSVIRAWGYDARPHLDGNYLAVLPPIAVTAGLGEVGRLGLLVTEECGPRVRLGAVTTDLPLVPDGPRPFGVQEFCRVCLKCARACPGRAIGRERDAPPSGWGIRWEDCYRFWRKVGTDCAVCLDVCPYSKPRSGLHRLFRLAVRGSPLGPRAAVWLDDLLYGRRPRRRPEPGWLGLHGASRGGRRGSGGTLGRAEALEQHGVGET